MCKFEYERAIKRYWSHLGKYKISSEVFERSDFEITAVEMFLKRQAKSAEEVGV